MRHSRDVDNLARSARLKLMHHREGRAVGGQAWLRRVVALLLATALLGSCGPTADATTRGDLRLSVAALKAVGEAGDTVKASIRVTNFGLFATRLELSGTAAWIEPRVTGELLLRAGEATDLEVELTCEASAQGRHARVQHAWLLLESAADSLVVPARLTCGTPTGADPGSASEFSPDDPLALEPPLLRNAQLVRIDAQHGPFILELERDADYLILMPDEPVRQTMTVGGGHNVVMIGGEIDIPWQGRNPSIAQRRGLYIRRTTGTFHLEGLLLNGEDISEGIQLNTPQADVQITNVAVVDIAARDQVGFSDNHPDLIQSFGGAKSITVDRFSGSTDYQGLLFQVTSAHEGHGPVTLRRVNLVGRPTARYLLWLSLPHDGETVTLEDVWLEVPERRRGGLGRAVWPDVNGDYPRRAERFQVAGDSAVRWPPGLNPPINGYVLAGTPPHGDFVDSELIGIGYSSPGYVSEP